MISAARFARDYSSFWNTLFPMTETLIRAINLNYQRFAPERKDGFRSDPQRRGLLNEVGFELAKLAWAQSNIQDESVQMTAYVMAAATLGKMDAKTSVEPLNDTEWQESFFLAERLMAFCREWPGENIVFAPSVAGMHFCGDGSAPRVAEDRGPNHGS